MRLEEKVHLQDTGKVEAVDATRLWLRLLTEVVLIEKELSVRLQKAFGISLARFDVLAQLYRQPSGMTLKELSERLLVTAGNVTRLTAQLEREGLLRREGHPKDRRSVLLRLTPEGKSRFADMARAHRAWLEELFSGLTESEREVLYRLMGKLRAHLRGLTREGRWKGSVNP